MRRLKYAITETRYLNYLAEGRGEGEGKNYIPWIHTRDCPSLGKVSQWMGIKTGRVHHFLSKYEWYYGLLLEWSDYVVDFREQFPLKLSETIEISNAIGVRHPYDNQAKFPVVRTTDFLITLQKDGVQTQIARTVKPSANLEKARTVSLFEVERCYWEKRGIDWGIVTEREIPEVLCKNLETILPCYNLKHTDSFDDPSELSFALVEVLKAEEDTILEALKQFDRRNGLEAGTALVLFKHLLARKVVVIDLSLELKRIFRSKTASITISDQWRRQYESSEKRPD